MHDYSHTGLSQFAEVQSNSTTWEFNAKGITTPGSIIPQGTVYFCDSDNYLYALNEDGAPKWTYQSANSGTPSSIGPDKTLFLVDGTGLVTLNSDGTKKWDYHPANVTLQSVSVDSNGIIYAASYENYLYALDSFGIVKWNYKSHGSIGQSVIGSDGTIYFNSGDGVIYALGQPIPEFPMPVLFAMISFIGILVIPRVFPRHM